MSLGLLFFGGGLILLGVCRLLRRGTRGTRMRSLRAWRPPNPLRISSGDYTTLKHPSPTIGRPRRPHKPNWPLQKAVKSQQRSRCSKSLIDALLLKSRTVSDAHRLLKFAKLPILRSACLEGEAAGMPT